jgi:hypothetical protein
MWWWIPSAITLGFTTVQLYEYSCIRAFQHYRLVISGDVTFLTSQFEGTLLVSIVHDANNRLLPLAFSLVKVENNDN